MPVGVNKFVFQADPPNLSRIPDGEIIGVTVILLTCSYDEREFVRVGYYVNNEYTDEALIADPPTKTVVEKVQRSILAEKPRVTRFAIKWDSEESAPAEYPPEQAEADAAEDDEQQYGMEELEEEQIEEGDEPETAETAETAEGEEAEPTLEVPAVDGATESKEGDTAEADDDDAASDAGSEDLEAESSGSEADEDEAEEDGEADEDEEAETEAEQRLAADADGDHKMAEQVEAKADTPSLAQEEASKKTASAPTADVMVH